MKFLKVITILLFFITFPVISIAQNDELPQPPRLSDSEEFVCGLRTHLLFVEISASNKNEFLTNLEAKDFEAFYKREKQEILLFTKGEILEKSNLDKGISEIYKASNSRYVIGILPDSLYLQEKIRKRDIEVSILKKKLAELGEVEVKIHNFFYN